MASKCQKTTQSAVSAKSLVNHMKKKKHTIHNLIYPRTVSCLHFTADHLFIL